MDSDGPGSNFGIGSIFPKLSLKSFRMVEFGECDFFGEIFDFKIISVRKFRKRHTTALDLNDHNKSSNTSKNNPINF
jgi:hypothetical protein